MWKSSYPHKIRFSSVCRVLPFEEGVGGSNPSDGTKKKLKKKRLFLKSHIFITNGEIQVLKNYDNNYNISNETVSTSRDNP